MRVLTLRKELTRSIRSGHPWIYSDAVEAARGGEPGELVEVRDQAGRFLARGFHDPGSPIAVRVLSLDESERLDRVVERRLAGAIALRERVIDRRSTTAFRLLNGEGDFLPGVVVDLYGTVAVARFDGKGARAFAREMLVAALRKQLDPLTCVFERAPRKSGVSGALWGKAPVGELEVREHGMTMLVDVVHGQKTGAFLDQRENRRMIRELASGARVLNTFSYSGGFTLAAALGGARSTVSVDIAEGALDTAKRTLERNGVSGDHAFVNADAFEYLEKLERDRFDLIVVDPPSLAPSKSSLDGALSAYRALNASAIGAIARNGLVAAASCSSHVDEPTFLEILRAAADDAKRRVRIVTIRGAGPDHPVAPAHPEGRYLKFVLLGVT